jgi:hypothetical protein
MEGGEWQEKRKGQADNDLALKKGRPEKRRRFCWLFGVAACRTRRRAGRRRLVFVRASPEAQSARQNCHDHNRFQKFQSISPPFLASCCRFVGKEV